MIFFFLFVLASTLQIYLVLQAFSEGLKLINYADDVHSLIYFFILPRDQAVYCAQAAWPSEGYIHWTKPTRDCKLPNANAQWEPLTSLASSHNYNTSAAYSSGINVTTHIPGIETGCFQLQSRKNRKKWEDVHKSH